MKFLNVAILISVIGLLFADQWQLYKKRFGKKYKNLIEEQLR